MSLDKRLTLLNELVREAGERLLASCTEPSLSITGKGPGDIVTEADIAIERMLRQRLAETFPQDGLIGEEFGGEPAQAGYTWLIDPIDGTVNFSRKLGYFCISIALLLDGQPVAAVIFDPVARELFSAGPDSIARLNGEPLVAIGVDSFENAVIGLGFSSRHGQHMQSLIVGALTANGAEHRRLGAGALCLAHVSAGRLDAYIEPHMNPWDAVGGLYIAQCAGAVTGDYIAQGGLTFGAPVYAAVPTLSPKLLALLPDPFSGIPLHRKR